MMENAHPVVFFFFFFFPSSNTGFAEFVDVFLMQSEGKNAYYWEGSLTQ